MIKIPFVIFRRGGMFVAYSLALDLSASGKSRGEARKQFDEAVELFIEEMQKKGEFAEWLQGMGWQKHGNEWTSPVFVTETHIAKLAS
jgi:predicted RNase H-like HicB family nuclease